MLKDGVPPGCMTDSVFLAGHCNGGQFADAPHLGDYYKAVAEAHGQDTKGKVYLSGLAAFPGDPRAWVDGRGDARRVLEERGWASEGAVSVKAAEPTGPPKRQAVDPALVTERVERWTEADPSLAEMDQGELRHEATESMKPPWADKE